MAVAPPPTTARHDAVALPSMKLAATPRIARRLVWVVLLGILLLPCVLAFVPWQQTVHGMGSAVAFEPTERPQFLIAPIEGRVKHWFVAEGDDVKEGAPLVEMLDVDEQLILRLRDEELAVESQINLAQQRVNELTNQMGFIDAARVIQKLQAQDSILAEERNLDAQDANVLAVGSQVDRDQVAFDRMDAAFKDGQRVSGQQRDDAQRDLLVSNKRLDATKKTRDAVKARLEQLRKRPDEIDRVIDGQLAGLKVTLASANESIETYRRTLRGLETRIAQQEQQRVFAPSDGRVFRITANAEGQLVSKGGRLGTFVPTIKKGADRDRETAESVGATFLAVSGAPLTPAPLLPQIAATLGRPGAIRSLTHTDRPGIVAELFIDGNDLPLVEVGDRVRLQFEGWAAVQFVSFPQAAEGTFGGLVYLVDPTANDKGDFRILVEPDPADRAWPNQDLLRQGVRAQGWVLMPQQVTMGWEVWRQLNGFPPYRPPAGKKDESGTIGPVPKRKSK